MYPYSLLVYLFIEKKNFSAGATEFYVWYIDAGISWRVRVKKTAVKSHDRVDPWGLLN